MLGSREQPYPSSFMQEVDLDEECDQPLIGDGMAPEDHDSLKQRFIDKLKELNTLINKMKEEGPRKRAAQNIHSKALKIHTAAIYAEMKTALVGLEDTVRLLSLKEIPPTPKDLEQYRNTANSYLSAKSKRARAFGYAMLGLAVVLAITCFVAVGFLTFGIPHLVIAAVAAIFKIATLAAAKATAATVVLTTVKVTGLGAGFAGITSFGLFTREEDRVTEMGRAMGELADTIEKTNDRQTSSLPKISA